MEQEQLDNLLKSLHNQLTQMSPDEMEALIPKIQEIPKGWVDIEEHLPHCLVDDFVTKGLSVYKVKNKNGTEFNTHVTDHDIWYHLAKDAGITHWWND